MTRKEELRSYKRIVQEADIGISLFKERFNEAVKNGDQNQIAYYQGCMDSLEWLKRDVGFGKRQV